jgi:hypothetical protein
MAADRGEGRHFELSFDSHPRISNPVVRDPGFMTEQASP